MIKKPLKIYLGDLTYTTLSLATDAFPLNIGYVGAYCQERFGEQVEITLFKYIDDLEGLEFFKMMQSIRPETLCIMGGSNIPHQPNLQAEFLKSRPMIDAYVYLEGEMGFSNIVDSILQQNGSESERAWLDGDPIAGCLFFNTGGHFIQGPVVPRLKALDEFPSPA